MEKPGAFGLARLADADAAEVSLARSLIKLGPRESAVKLQTVLGWPYPDGQAVGLILEK